MTDIPKMTGLDAEAERLVAKVQEVADAIRSRRMALLLPILGRQLDMMNKPPTSPTAEQMGDMFEMVVMSVLMAADTADAKAKAP